MKKQIYISLILMITLIIVSIINISAKQYYYYGKEKINVFQNIINIDISQYTNGIYILNIIIDNQIMRVLYIR